MTMEKNFCKLCGSKLTEIDGVYFDEFTGQKEKTKICLKCRPCAVTGHDYKQGGLFGRVLGVKTCQRCGHWTSTEDY